MRALFLAALLLAAAAHADAGAAGVQLSVLTKPFNAQLATGTATSSADKIGSFDTVLVGITYAGITGSPLTCTIQPQNSVDGSNFFAWGPAISIAPGASAQMLAVNAHPTPVGQQMRYVYACGTYPTAGTLTLQASYSGPDDSVNRAFSVNGTAIQSGMLVIGGNDGTNARQLALTTGGLLKDDLEQIAGSNVVAASAGILKVGAVGNAGAAFDAANNASLPANGLLFGVESLAVGTTPTAATGGNFRRVTGDLAGNQYTTVPVPWSCSLSALAASLTQCQAAPGAGFSLYVTSIMVTTTTGTAGTFAIRYGTGTNCATGTKGFWPQPEVSSPTNTITAPINTAQPFVWPYPSGKKVAAANALCVIGVATNTIDITISGYIAPG